MIKSQWRAAQSFQENQDLISAINTLSIHIKLEMAGHNDLNSAETIQQAREDLYAFLMDLNPQISRAETERAPLLGVDPRRRQFIKRLIDAKQNSRLRSPFLSDKLPEGAQLLYAGEEGKETEVLLFLEELRMLLEEHIGTDVEQLFGGL